MIVKDAVAVQQVDLRRAGGAAGLPRADHDAIRAKIFGLNALRPYGISAKEATMRAQNDAVARQRENYAGQRDPHHLTFGPQTRREFLRFLSGT